MFYTYIIRYHHYSGNVSLQSSFKEFFGKDTAITNILYPTNLGSCLKELRMDVDEYIKKHSVLPYYRMFLKKEIYDSICVDMLCDAKPYVTKIKSTQRQIAKVKSNRLFYCPMCMSEDKCYENIQIMHQLSEVHVCTKHKCYLNSISLRPFKRLINIDEWDMNITPCDEESILLQVARDVEYIMKTQPELDITTLRACLMEEAIKRNIYRNGKWNEKAVPQWKFFYDNLPKEYNVYKDVLSFNKFAARQQVIGIDAVEYLLFIQSLYGRFEKFAEVYL